MLDLKQPLYGIVGYVLDADECAQFIEKLRDVADEPAPITTGAGFELITNIRNNSRLIVDDETVAAGLWSRIKEYIPRQMHEWSAHGLNERFRLYRYLTGQKFAPHYDGAFVRNDDEVSMLTVLFYLDDEMEGGATDLIDFEVVVRPKRGRLLFFQHHTLHEGCEVLAGRKCVLRTDVMYRNPLVSASRS